VLFLPLFWSEIVPGFNHTESYDSLAGTGYILDFDGNQIYSETAFKAIILVSLWVESGFYEKSVEKWYDVVPLNLILNYHVGGIEQTVPSDIKRVWEGADLGDSRIFYEVMECPLSSPVSNSDIPIIAMLGALFFLPLAIALIYGYFSKRK